ncbi:hypothetical protein [Aquimarina algiphila]|uniref:Uncharacterized protein n=2 Tax=Aquimarina algiphila TaxID=2047982 RepID=A0A554VA53_9FLAO|nr:hypothetical protein [Aquimarina algiphila]TSE02696.1 hypothetical protein FOF46_30560 [Aquimarina algiphila]TSE03064.1 hypothetical protein FOF46_30020 [Aquimarina algiphila]TSE06954.1 hypothetical protein FOF46_17160 [Aquimarina algiphila]
MQAQVTIGLEVKDKTEAHQVKKAFETMNKHFGAKGIIHMEKLFLNDAFIRNLVKMKINKK